MSDGIQITIPGASSWPAYPVSNIYIYIHEFQTLVMMAPAQRRLLLVVRLLLSVRGDSEDRPQHWIRQPPPQLPSVSFRAPKEVISLIHEKIPLLQ